MKNLLKKQFNYDEDGKLDSTVEFDYDEFSNEIKSIFTDLKGEKTISTHTYKYDSNNNICCSQAIL